MVSGEQTKQDIRNPKHDDEKCTLSRGLTGDDTGLALDGSGPDNDLTFEKESIEGEEEGVFCVSNRADVYSNMSAH